MWPVRYFLVWGALASGLPAGEDLRRAEERQEGTDRKKVGEKQGKGGSAKKSRLAWVTPEDGFARVRKKSLPAIILFEEPQPPLGRGGDENSGSESTSFLSSHFSKARLRGVLKKFVLIRVSGEDLKREYPAASKQPPGLARATIGEELGIEGDKPEVVVLNYWEDDVLRYAGKLPRLSRFKKELTRIRRVNKIYAHRARKVTAALEKSRYAFKLKNRREAVLKIRSFESEKEQNRMDPVLRKRVNDAIQEYRRLADNGIKKAGKLEKKKKFLEAIEAYDDVMKHFPFQDLIVLCSKKKSELLRNVLGVR